MTSRVRRATAPIATATSTVLLALVVGGQPAATAQQAERTDRADRPGRAAQPVTQLDTPLVVGHRGASGYRPEHTLAAYRLAVQMGAEVIEPDLVPTKDGVLVARHENEISGTTDVADRPEFADRRTTKVVDGVPITGWFTEDFTLAELRTLRAVERLPEVRPANTEFDGRYGIPTLAQVLRLADRLDVAVAPETKHPTYFDSIGLSLEEPLVAELRAAGLTKRKSPVLVQSFETANLRELDTMTKVPLVQLVSGSGAPYDAVAAGEPTTYADLVTPAGLAEVSTYADWLGPEKNVVLPRDPVTGATGEPSAVVDDAHAAGLRVVVYTLRAENQFMATNFRRGTDPDAFGDMGTETVAFLEAGVDALFTDHPDIAVDARDAWVVDRG